MSWIASDAENLFNSPLFMTSFLINDVSLHSFPYLSLQQNIHLELDLGTKPFSIYQVYIMIQYISHVDAAM